MLDSKQGWQRFLPRPNSNGDFRSPFANAFAGQTICVAGAGGDIGSALVKALAPAEPRSLILLDSAEHGLFELRRHIESTHPSRACEYILGSVGDRVLLDETFSRLGPHTIFHAAAFKHVGLLEHNPFAAIQNNVLGTHNLLRAALDHGVSNFVFLSTDKAVNPHSVMGVSKRIAEMITLSTSCQAMRASAIRLANVIGSRGSVVPIFLDQIANRRPLTVTHPQTSRYFISREQAVDAILAAGVAEYGGMILVPELDAPVLIAGLAKFLIETFDASATSTITFTGLRPGEKLTEALVGENETETGTAEGLLRRVAGVSARGISDAIAQLSACVADRNRDALLRMLCDLVPDYVPSTLMQETAAVPKIR